MLTASKLLAQGLGLASVLLKRAAMVELDWDVRQKSRFSATDNTGRQVAVFLPRGTVVRGGDVLVAEDGSLIRVVAAAQAVLVITACSTHGSPFDLIRAAYHLGNRHVPIELQADHLKIEPDYNPKPQAYAPRPRASPISGRRKFGVCFYIQAE